MSTSEDQQARKTARGSGGNLQSKDINEPDTEANDRRDEPQPAPAMEAANQSSQ